jgi:hypothetical protein
MPHRKRFLLNRSTQEAEIKAQCIELGSNGLPILTCTDEDYDVTIVDLTDSDGITITQVDEHGVTHTIILSDKIVQQMHPYMRIWKCLNIKNDND